MDLTVKVKPPGEPSFAVPVWTDLDCTLAVSDVSTWRLRLPRGGRIDTIARRAGTRWEFHRDGALFLSGIATARKVVVDESNDYMELRGVDDTVYLRDRVVHPEPASTTPPYNSSSHDVRTGVASTVMRGYVDANVGPSAVAPRRKLTLASDPAVGNTVDARGRWANTLLAYLQGLADLGGVVFRVVDLEFDVWAPADKTETVRFSFGAGNISGYQLEDRAPVRTYVYVLGGGEGTSRTVVERQNQTAIAAERRIESTVDRRDTTDASTLASAGDEVLAEAAASLDVQIEAIENGDTTLWGSGYDLGDTVNATTDEGVFDLPVRKIRLVANDRSTLVHPQLGGPSPTPTELMWRAIDDVELRLSRLEAI